MGRQITETLKCVAVQRESVMSQDALVKTVQEQAEKGEFDGLDETLDEMLDGRPDEWFYRENDSGILHISDARAAPEIVVTVELINGEMKVDTVDPETINWRQFRTISSPSSRVESRQFD